MSEHVEVTGTGAASATPDRVVLDVRVSKTERDVATALDACATAVAAVLQAATDRGITGANRRTTGIGVYPQHDSKGERVVGYQAWQTLRLASTERSTVGALLTAVATAGGNAVGIDNVSLDLSDPAPLLVGAREAAFADAKAKAEQYAALAGRTLGAVRRVVETGGTVMAKAAADFGGRQLMAASMPVEAGESSVSASVTVRWELS